jgi:hypothetical protein
METITVKPGGEIRSRDSLRCDPPIGVVVDASDGVVTIVLKTNDADLASSMHSEAEHQRSRRDAGEVRKRRTQRRLEKRRAG